VGSCRIFAGLVFFPLLVLGAWEVLLAALGRWRRPTIYSLGVAVASTGVAFVLVKTTAAGSMAFAWALGWLQWSRLQGGRR
jgi:hypothetical protein